jgi:hypothetical protein
MRVTLSSTTSEEHTPSPSTFTPCCPNFKCYKTFDQDIHSSTGVTCTTRRCYPCGFAFEIAYAPAPIPKFLQDILFGLFPRDPFELLRAWSFSVPSYLKPHIPSTPPQSIHCPSSIWLLGDLRLRLSSLFELLLLFLSVTLTPIPFVWKIYTSLHHVNWKL